MADFRIQTGWFSGRKRRRLRRLLGADGEIALFRLWAYATENRPSGDLSGLDADDITDETGWEGDPQELVTVLIECRLLDTLEGDLRIHNWAKHNPWAATAERRRWVARKGSHARWAKQGRCAGGTEFCSVSCGSNATSNADSQISNAPTPAPTPTPTPTPTHNSSPRGSRGVSPIKLGGQQATLTRQVKEIFEYWTGLHSDEFLQPHPALPEFIQIERRITQDGCTVEQIKKAIDGIHRDPWKDRKRNLSLWHVVKELGAVQGFVAIIDNERDPDDRTPEGEYVPSAAAYVVLNPESGK